LIIHHEELAYFSSKAKSEGVALFVVSIVTENVPYCRSIPVRLFKEHSLHINAERLGSQEAILCYSSTNFTVPIL